MELAERADGGHECDGVERDFTLAVEASRRTVCAGDRFDVRLVLRNGELLRRLDATLQVTLSSGLRLASDAGTTSLVLPVGEMLRSDGEYRFACLAAADHPATELAIIAAQVRVPDGAAKAATSLSVVVVRRACLENAGSAVTLLPRCDGRYDATVVVRNDGPSVAAHVRICVPAPQGMIVEGTCAAADSGEAEIGFEQIDVGGIAEARVTLRLSGPVPATFVALSGVRVACQGTPQFFLQTATCEITPHSVFNDPGALTIVGSNEPEAGERVVLRLRAQNDGNIVLSEVTASISLPEGLRYAPGSGRWSGAPLFARTRSVRRGRRGFHGKRRVDDALPDVSLHRLGPGEVIEMEVHAYAVPVGDGEEAVVTAKLAWSGGSRSFELPVRLRGSAAFPTDRNRVEIDGPMEARAGDTIRFRMHVQNAGAVAAESIRIVLDSSAFEAVTMDGPMELGTLDAGEERVLEGHAQIPAEIENGRPLSVAARIFSGEHSRGILTSAEVTARSIAHFCLDRSGLECVGGEPLRPGGCATVRICVTNDGSETARNVCAVLELPEGVELGDRSAHVRLGDVAPRQSASQDVAIRLKTATNGPLPIRADLHADNILPSSLDPIWIHAKAEARFDVSLKVEPFEPVELGETLTVQLAAENVGDGVARRLRIDADPATCAVYISGSTVVNGRSLIDRGAGAALYGRDGLWFEDIAPGTRLTVCWSLHAHEPVDGLVIRARLSLEDGSVVSVCSPLVSITSGETAVPAAEFPFRCGASVRPTRIVCEPIPPRQENAVIFLDLDTDASTREKMIAFFQETDYGTLVTHVLALRMLVAGGIEGEANADALLQSYRTGWRDAVDRLYIKLRIPSYRVVPRDLEDGRARGKLTELLSALRACSPRPSAERPHVLYRRVELGEIDNLLGRLEGCALGGPLTMEAVATLVPNESVSSPRLADALSEYLGTMREILRTFDQDVDAFHRSLHDAAPAKLDAARAEFLSALTSGR